MRFHPKKNELYYEDGRFKKKHTVLTIIKVPYQMKLDFQFYCARRHRSMSSVLKRIVKKLLQREKIKINKNIKVKPIYDEPEED